MWKLILILTLFWRLFPFDQKDAVIIVLDDCEKWRIVRNGLGDERNFIYNKELPDYLGVFLSHVNKKDKPELQTRKLTLKEIQNEEFYYSSELNFYDWNDIDELKNKKVFIVMTEDFCSRNRFVYGYSFTLYEVNIYFQRNE